MLQVSIAMVLAALAGCEVVFPLTSPNVGCSPAAMLTDDFEDGVILPWWQTEVGIDRKSVV